MYGPGQLPDRASVTSGKLQAGGIVHAYIYVWRVYFDYPPEGHRGQLAYTFVIRRLSPKFQSFLSAVTLAVLLCGFAAPTEIDT